MTRVHRKCEAEQFLDAWFIVRQTVQSANFNRFQNAGLSATQFMTLNLLPHQGGIGVVELARRMNLSPATVVKTIDSLERREMLTRVRSQADRRRVLVCITASGKALQNAASGRFREQMETLFHAMSPPVRRGLVAGLQGLARAAEALPPVEITRPENGVAPALHSTRGSRRR